MNTIPQKVLDPPPPPPEPQNIPGKSQSNPKGLFKFKPTETVVVFLIVLASIGAYFLMEGQTNAARKISQDNIEIENKIQSLATGKFKPNKKPDHKEKIPEAIKIAPSIIPENSNIPLEQQVYTVKNGQFAIKSEVEARKLGYAIINLSNNFTPYIFTDGLKKENAYRDTFLNIANDHTDESGKKLKKGEHNYKELYGIPPSLSIIQQRYLDDSQKECYKDLKIDFFRKSRTIVKYNSRRNLAKEVRQLKLKVQKAQKKTGKKSLNQLAKVKKYKYLVKKYRLMVVKLSMVIEAQKRLKCEGLLESYSPGYISWDTIKAIKDFEHKHMIYGWGIIAGKTRKGFGRTPLANNFRAFRRVLEARISWSLGILEDGSVNKSKNLKASFKGKDGKTKKIPNLIKLYTDLLLKKLQADTPVKSLEFFSALPQDTFKKFRIAVKLPELPEYYNSDMDFEVEIDRGDVYYDAPFDANGAKRSQPKYRRPRITLFTNYNDQKIPLINWGTTVGGWRTEFKDGKVYYAYKNSDVGKRIWKDIYAAPVWIPPKSTPPSGLMKSYYQDRRWITRLNQEEIGPSYASAYGLVAAHHIRNRSDSGKPIWFDNGIRTHGSVDYMSIMRRHSHGCHRLHNHLAIRLFSTILKHHQHERIGQSKLIYQRKFIYNDKEQTISINTRGYRFSLEQPVKVNVLPGRILGKLKKPYEGYIRKPGVEYDENDENLLSPEEQKKLEENKKENEEKENSGTNKQNSPIENKVVIEKSDQTNPLQKKLPPPPPNKKPVK
ncbi:MAG: L,D-transpeptidase [Deltaproteobacteria bacterium]|jgi:hypothetical protein|nr:L,D-transpeptidase [Deltaproteobacteria bacterium]